MVIEVDPLYLRFCKFIKIGEVSSCLLINLVDDILDMSKFESKTFQLNINQFKLGELLKDIDYIFGFQCAEKRLDFKIECPTSWSSKTYMSDQKRIKQVLINLISNSFKFTEKGRIKVEIKEIKLNEQEFLKFTVSDTGVGISKQDIPKLFKMFGILSKHRNKMNKTGSGLGLSISKRIVESLEGKIKVSSWENMWTKFTFTIKNLINRNIREEESKNLHDLDLLNQSDKEESKQDIVNQQMNWIEQVWVSLFLISKNYFICLL